VGGVSGGLPGEGVRFGYGRPGWGSGGRRDARRLQARAEATSRRDQRMMVEELRELGYEFTQDDLNRARELESAKAWAGRLPSDKELARTLGLSPFYSHVYRSGSGAVHYSIFTMLEGFERQPESVAGAGASVSLTKPERERAADALVFGAVTHGVFLEKSEPVIQHGITQQALELVGSHFADPETIEPESPPERE
jgi:hypothetical protein